MSDGSKPWVDAIAQRKQDNEELWRRFINPGFVDLMGLVGYGRRFVRAEGLELVDDQGRAYLDFVSGYGALNLGHNHPAIKRTLAATLEMDLPSYSQVECGLPAGLAAESLVECMPKGLDKVFWCSSGSEAVEAAMKLARAATRRSRLVACEGAFHGTTLGALGLMGHHARRD